MPTRNRHPSATVLVREGRLLLFDCGEGTQMRLMEAGLPPTRIDAVFVTHLHGDHFFGLMGLLSTLSLMDRPDPLTIVAPVGLSTALTDLPGLDLNRLGFDLHFVDLPDTLEQAVVYEDDAFHVEARPIDHRTFAVGYRLEEAARPGHLDVERARALGVTEYADFRALKRGEAVEADARVVTPEEVVGPERKGRAFAYVTDTRPCENGRVLARDADLVYHEATFGEAHSRRATETAHSTAGQAADVARRAGARRLLIGHFSARYDDASGLLDEAQSIFKNTEVAEELKRYSI
ncbi:MAG: ribonuclease Z [Rhodothermales bacterium]